MASNMPPILSDADAAVLYEDAVLKYNRQKQRAEQLVQSREERDGKSRSDFDDDDNEAAACDMGLLWARSQLLASLEYASQAADDKSSSHASNEAATAYAVRQLLEMTQLQCDSDVELQPSSWQPKPNALPPQLYSQLGSLLMDNSKCPDSTTLADDFFNEYPECGRQLNHGRRGGNRSNNTYASSCSSSSSSEDESEIEKSSGKVRKKRVSPTSALEMERDDDDAMVESAIQMVQPMAHETSKATVPSNPYANSTAQRSDSTASTSGVHQRIDHGGGRPPPPPPPPSNASIVDLTSDVPNGPLSRPSSRGASRQQQQSNSGSNSRSSNNTWEDHHSAVLPQANPFQTAREYELANGGNNNSNNSNSRRPDNGHDTPNQQHYPPPSHYQQQQPPPPHNAYPQHPNPFQQQHPQHPPQQQPYNPYRKPDSPPPPAPMIRESLKRKFQPPVKKSGGGGSSSDSFPHTSSSRPSSRGGNGSGSNGGTKPSSDDTDDLPEELKRFGKDLVEKIENEIMESGDSVSFEQIAGLADQKQTVQEVVCWPMKRPDLFTGLRRAPNGLLLYGPPGTGKTLIGKAIAFESGATFFSISSSSLTSKWIGEGEKLVRVLFAVAAYRQPAVVFIDEIDSLLTQRKADENEATRRIKTEFLVCLDGTGTSGQGRVLVIGATNRPQELDEAARRRFTKRLYIPLPETDDREILIRKLLTNNNHRLVDDEVQALARDTDGFSGADLQALCTDAAMGPIRQLGSRALEVEVKDVPPISYKHFRQALKGMKPSVSPDDLVQYIEWDKLFGSKRGEQESDDDDDSPNDDA